MDQRRQGVDARHGTESRRGHACYVRLKVFLDQVQAGLREPQQRNKRPDPEL
jgi:hypothetical protein